ncbi:MAG: hypothetical protein PHZ25_00280 [Candidatus Pacebacteria bacterium]|nr:hypothetical protein [Candidatus Paceibacterota bacterium]
MFPQPNWKWKCKECEREFYGFVEKDVPVRLKKCPNCGSEKIKSEGPMICDAPLENFNVKY